MKQKLSQGGKLEIVLVGSASSPQTEQYNDKLSQRRIDAVRKYFLETLGLQVYLDNKQITFVENPEGETIVIFSTTYFSVLYTTGGTFVESYVKSIKTPLFLAVELLSVYLNAYEHFNSHFPLTFEADIFIF